MCCLNSFVLPLSSLRVNNHHHAMRLLSGNIKKVWQQLKPATLPRRVASFISCCLPALVFLAAQALDESHTISNTTGAARLVTQLIANRRWCITGYVPSIYRVTRDVLVFSSTPFNIVVPFCCGQATRIPSTLSPKLI